MKTLRNLWYYKKLQLVCNRNSMIKKFVWFQLFFSPCSCPPYTGRWLEEPQLWNQVIKIWLFELCFFCILRSSKCSFVFGCLLLKDRPAAEEKRSLFVDCFWKRDLPAGAGDHLSYSETLSQNICLFLTRASPLCPGGTIQAFVQQDA